MGVTGWNASVPLANVIDYQTPRVHVLVEFYAARFRQDPESKGKPSSLAYNLYLFRHPEPGRLSASNATDRFRRKSPYGPA